MAYPALTLHLLISAPGDVPDDDRRVVREAIDAWNFTSGRWLVPTPVTVIPVKWGVHAYSQMGVRPQEALNKQFVQESDMALAIFANRLGTPTGEADSGTVEEIDVMRRAGKPVSLVRNTSVAMSGGTDAAEQRLKLENYLAAVIKDRQGLVVQYDQLHVLHRQIDLMLTGQAMAFSRAAAQPTEAVISERDATWNVEEPDPPTADPTVGVWPSVEVVERPTTDSKGRLKTRRTWYLVLNNATGRPVRNVHFRYETGEDSPSTCARITRPSQRWPRNRTSAFRLWCRCSRRVRPSASLRGSTSPRVKCPLHRPRSRSTRPERPSARSEVAEKT